MCSLCWRYDPHACLHDRAVATNLNPHVPQSAYLAALRPQQQSVTMAAAYTLLLFIQLKLSSALSPTLALRIWQHLANTKTLSLSLPLFLSQ